MDRPDVWVVELGPTKVATYRCAGEHPKDPALDALIVWASEKNLLAKDRCPRFFGFSDPLPAEDDPVYGFEAWMTVGDDVAGDDTVRIQENPGGLYAVTRATPGEFAGGAAWKRFESHLDPWMEEHRYQYDDTRQWLEERIPDLNRIVEFPELRDQSRWIAFDLWIPIEPVEGDGTAPARRTNKLRNLVALAVSIVVLAFTSGVIVGLEVQRGANWQLELDEYIAQTTLSSETVTIESVVEATEPSNFSAQMGTAMRDDWRWGAVAPSVPPTAVKCVLLERSRAPTAGGGEESKRQVVFLAYHTDALYRVGWRVYAGPQAPFAQELLLTLSTIGCDLDLE